MALDAIRAADDQNGIIQHLQRPLHLRGKIHMAGGVHQRQLRFRQLQPGQLGENGDAPLPLQRIVVQKGVLVIYPAQTADAAARVEQALGKRGLSRVHMGQDADRKLFHAGLSAPEYPAAPASAPRRIR